MDFANERYVRLYVRDTSTWLLLEFEGQTVLMHLLRKADRSGVIDLAGREPWTVPVMHCRIPGEFSRKGMESCLREGVIVHDGDRLVFPRYLEANETPQSDLQRVREHRARELAKRAELKRNVTVECNETLPIVTLGNAVQRGETIGNSVPCLSVPDHAVPSVPETTDVGVTADVWHVFDHWRGLWRKGPATKLTPKRKACIQRALKNYPIAELVEALDGAHLSPHHLGQNNTGEVYDELELHLRGPEKIEAHRDRKRRGVVKVSVVKGMGPVGTAEEYAADAAGGIAPWET